MEIAPRKTQIDYSKLESSKVLFPKGTNDRRIFHYTSIGGLQGILEHKTLRFTNIHYMNDKDEILAGLDSMAKEVGASSEERKKFHTAFYRKKSRHLCAASPLKKILFPCGTTIPRKSITKDTTLNLMTKN